MGRQSCQYTVGHDRWRQGRPTGRDAGLPNAAEAVPSSVQCAAKSGETMKFTLCNEVIRELSFERQCALAADLGYQGLELAPFTLGKDAWRMPQAERARFRQTAADHGLAISGLHWLLIDPPGLSITSADADVRRRTIDVSRSLIGLCHDLGGAYLVHGSPGQRKAGGDPDARRRGRDAFASVAADAAAAGVTYCIEPLS